MKPAVTLSIDGKRVAEVTELAILPAKVGKVLKASELAELAEKIITPELRPGIDFHTWVVDGEIVIGVLGMFRGKSLEMNQKFKLGDADACNVEAVTRAARYVAELVKRSR